eukprot:GILI01010537.1.p1 GENE.GILI01010537.1~~GILI01010537.1.p1  ORF type:complete len:250 (+),score=84.60 GILI01010537.1:114-863(+)
MADSRPSHVLALFDVDGTLTKPRNKATPELLAFMKELRSKVHIGVVGGSDLHKITEQLGDSVLQDFDFVFSENGLVAHKDGAKLAARSIGEELGEDSLKQIINWVLRYFADLDIPVKRGTFIEYRTGMLNISPIGRNCNQKERDEFEQFDKVHKVRETMVAAMRQQFAHLNLQFSIGGQISIDLFPQGWDKTYCLRFLEQFTEIHFFGDKTDIGGNDYEIYSHPRTVGHSVKTFDDTIRECREIFFREN